MDIFHQILKQYWGYNDFRPLQEEIIRSVSEGRDTLGLMPTGGGKSLTFQVPTIAMEGLCLVITPLIALMKDQVDNLRNRSIKALAVYSGMPHQEILTTLDNAILGDYKFLYVSPERLASDLFLKKLQEMNICLLVIDESHCISQWGYDFRPSYLKIAEIRKHLPNVPVLALTATATPMVVEDIQQQLSFKTKNVIYKSFERKNISYIVRSTENKYEELINILSRINGSGIVYVRSRLRTKEFSDFLNQNNISADYYHAGLSTQDKEKKQNSWKENKIRIIVCTNAFGMGIDKSDVRIVVHVDLPNSIEEYYQEAGRAGRDEKKSYAVILYNKNDVSKLKKRIKDEFPERDFVLNVYEYLAYFFQIAEGFGSGMTFDFNLKLFCANFKLPLLPTHNALKILDLSEYIEYTDEVDNRSRIIFCVYRDELYHYKFDKIYEQLINIVLRLYTGLFANYVTIDESEIALRLNISRKDVYEMLKALSKRKIIDYIPHKKTPLISYRRPRVDIKHLIIPVNVYEVRKERFENQIESIINYTINTCICRNRVLLAYFGENETSDCNQCDICLNKNKTKLSDTRFKEITDSIKEILSTSSVDINMIIDNLSQHASSDIISTIQFLSDNNIITIDKNIVSLRNK